MPRMRKWFHGLRLPGKQKGQILSMVLIFLLLGSIMITPLLVFMSSGLSNNQVYDDKTAVIYAVDAGIEDAKWKIQYDKLVGLYSPYDFTNPYTYQISQGQEVGENINQYPVDVSIQNIWIPKDIPAPSIAEANAIVNTNKLVVVGTTSVPGTITVTDPDHPGQTISISQYKIKIIYTHGAEPLTDLRIESIGIWLPKGFTYFSDPNQTWDPDGVGPEPAIPIQSQLEDLGTGYDNFEAVPTSYAIGGNESLVWDYSLLADRPPLYDFPPSVITKINNITTLDFYFFFRVLDPAQPAAKPDSVAWVQTSGVNGVSYSWNADIKVYEIQSSASDVTVTAHLTKSGLRTMSSAVAGDYYATGNSLMRDAYSDSKHIRDTWLNPDHSSTAAVAADNVGELDENPTEIAAAYLYWTGWKNKDSMTNLFSEDCTTLDQWETSSSEFQTRVPTGDGVSVGTWNTILSPCWDDLDETVPNDNDYMTGSTVASTGWLNPTANAVDTGGDNNGFEGNPTNAYTDGSGAANNINGADDRQRYFGYNTSSIPSGSTINGIEVRLDWWLDSTSSSNNISAALSWNGGTSWSNAMQTSTEPTVEATSVLGSSSDTWGHSWNTNELASGNYTVRLTCNSGDGNRDFYLDWVPVRISYTLPVSENQKLFTFAPFSIPSSLPVNSLTVYYRAEDESSGTNNIRSAIKVNHTVYFNADPGTNPDDSWNNNTFSYTYTTNPATGAAWTPEDINGTGTHPFQQFGVYSSDLNPGIRVSMVYARVDCGFDSLWSVSGNRYQGQGSPSANDFQRTLTMRNNLDLSAYGPGTVHLSWSQSESGTLETGDALQYSLSGDGGMSWSDPNTEAFHDDDPPGTFSAIIPEEYLTTSFKIRFFFNFNAADEYVYLDDIAVTTELYSEDCSSFSDGKTWDLSGSSRWTIESNRFRGQGSGAAAESQMTLTLHDGINLEGYEPGLVWVNWEQTISGDLEPEDTLFFSFYSPDGEGDGWSSPIESLHGNNTNRYFCYQVPTEYLVSGFRLRFYFNLNSTSEHVFLDNIALSVMAPDKSVYFKINGQQVYFDDSFQPVTGSYEIVASQAEIIPGIISGNFYGYSYACFKDVTALVRQYTKVDEGEDTEHAPGVATYAVGHVDASLGIDDGSSSSQMSHAGWSLILVYTSLQTSGHQLYLFDRFSLADDNTDLDFDRDGLPGGDISGFIVPERIEVDGVMEENVGKMTVFVGEGDNWIEGEFIAFQAPDSYNPEDIPDSYKLWDGISTNGNSRSSPDNVWNSQSTVLSADGVDIDTFDIPWESGGLEQGDSSAHVDMYTEQDNWNMIYIILSFRSQVTYGGALSYLIDD
jgi:hypothetical protein